MTGKEATHLETAHVLFIDVAGYSKLLVNEQREVLQQLNEIVRNAPQSGKSSTTGKLIRIPSGDGMGARLFPEFGGTGALRDGSCASAEEPSADSGPHGRA